MAALRSRSTSDTLLLMIAGTVCVSVLLSVLTAVILQFVQPDNKGGFAAISEIINTLISLLAGFLAGRTDAAVRNRDPGPEKERDQTGPT